MNASLQTHAQPAEGGQPSVRALDQPTVMSGAGRCARFPYGRRSTLDAPALEVRPATREVAAFRSLLLN